MPGAAAATAQTQGGRRHKRHVDKQPSPPVTSPCHLVFNHTTRSYYCSNNYFGKAPSVLNGAYSRHSNRYEDRIWAFKCTQGKSSGAWLVSLRRLGAHAASSAPLADKATSQPRSKHGAALHVFNLRLKRLVRPRRCLRLPSVPSRVVSPRRTFIPTSLYTASTIGNRPLLTTASLGRRSTGSNRTTGVFSVCVCVLDVCICACARASHHRSLRGVPPPCPVRLSRLHFFLTRPSPFLLPASHYPLPLPSTLAI